MSLQLKSLDFIVVGEGIVTGKVILAGIDQQFSSENKIKKYISRRQSIPN